MTKFLFFLLKFNFPFPLSKKYSNSSLTKFLFWFFKIQFSVSGFEKIPQQQFDDFLLLFINFNSITGVEDLLQKHSLVEADINVLGERVKQVVQHSQRFLEEEAVEGYQPCDPSIIVDRVSGNYLYFF